jgi:asparagine synthase (glutamine-hydrolysing)
VSGIFGLWNSENYSSVHRDWFEAMATPFHSIPEHKVESTTCNNGTLGIASLHDNGVLLSTSRYIAVVVGRPYFKNKLYSNYNFSKLSEEIIHGLIDSGPEILSELSGSFAIALYTYENSELLLAVDRIGAQSLVYHQFGNTLAFSNSADSIRLIPDTNLIIAPQSILNYVYFHVIPGPTTIYQNVSRLSPGTYLIFKNGRTTEHRYWQLEYREETNTSYNQFKEEFFDVLKNSISGSASENCGAFLSGGTDSSTVTGMLRDTQGRSPQTYSIGFDVHGYDEISYARIAAKHFGSTQHEYYVSPKDVVETIPLIAKAYDSPFGNSSAIAAYQCAKLAREDGIESLLAGDGGDELFGGNYRYAKQHLYSLYDTIPNLLSKNLFPSAINMLVKIAPFFYLKKIQSYINQAKLPMPERMETYNLVNRIGLENIFTKDFLSTVSSDIPLGLIDKTYFNCNASSMLNRMLAVDMKFTLADNDLPKVVHTCELAGIEPRFPLLSSEMIDFANRLPSRLKLKGTHLRYFFKKALTGYLPNEVIHKSKHGFGLPYGHWLQEYAPLKELTFDSLSNLKTRGYIESSFIDELIKSRLNEHAGYYGTMIWVLVMLEQWFQHHTKNSS